MTSEKKILIIGAGPTGLGAAWRLHELGHSDWTLCEASEKPGGLAGSVIDAKGFTWDLGGHVIFSHWDYFDRLMDDLMGEHGWLHHERESWVWMRNRFVPYPFQSNIRHLPKEILWECIEGLLDRPDLDGRRPRDFEEFIHGYFGRGIAEHFLMPYNFKVWAYPPREMQAGWVGERVAPVDLRDVLRNIVLELDKVSWGPNSTFRFPAKGGTGAVWSTLASRLPAERMRYGQRLCALDTKRRVAKFTSGDEMDYDALITTIPLDQLVRLSDRDDLAPAADSLIHSSSHIVGVGLKGQPPAHLSTKCWMYFPESDCPFYRTTVFSNYSPAHVPDPASMWSLMTETSESPVKPVEASTIIDQTIQGLLNTRLIESADQVIDVFATRLECGYPTPSVGRDDALKVILPALDSVGVFSRGRFGAWKYEVANQDHSLMQGVEAAERILLDVEEQTLWNPDFVNSGRARERSTGPVPAPKR